jgi:hypothetical protein
VDEHQLELLRSAIWYDVQLNGMIGNGNELAWRWYNAGRDDAPKFHIQELTCHPGENTYRCAFVLLRDGGEAEFLGKRVSDKLNCKADFLPDPETEGAWRVDHLPPPKGGGQPGRV